MKKTRLIVRFLLLCALLAGALSLYVSAEEGVHPEHSRGIAVRTEAELLQMESGKYYYLDADITVTETVNIGGNISLCLNGKILRYENTEDKGSLFCIEKEGSLGLFDCSSDVRGFVAGADGLWTPTDGSGAENSKELKGGAIIGGTGEKREIEELNGSYFCGGFAYVDGGSLSVYGGNIVGNQADYGGAVYITGDGRLTVNGGQFCGNLASFRGGAVFAHSGTVLLNGGVISENKAVKNGGGIDISGEGILEMRGGSVTGNTAGAWSGGIENFGVFDMYGGTVSGNSAAEDGGGVYNGGFFTMHGGTIRENAAKYGGGVCNDSKMTVHGGSILANLAQESGGGIYNADALVINDGRIASNTAVTSGGGIENDGMFTMYGGTVGGTYAEEANMAYLGGGVCVYRGTFAMYGGTIEKNTGVDGGGVENEATCIIRGGTVRHNYAALQGGGITNRGHLVLSDGAEITTNASGAGENEHRGGGIYWITGESTSVSVSGTVRVSGNTTNGANANLIIYGKGAVSVSDISEQTQISLTLLNANKNIASGVVAQMTDTADADEMLSSFSSDHTNFELHIKNGELVLSERNLSVMIGVCTALVTLIAGTAFAIVLFKRKKRKCK